MLIGVVPVQGQPASQTRETKQKLAISKVFEQFWSLNKTRKLKSAKSILTGEAGAFTQVDSMGPMSAADSTVIIDPRHAVVRVQGMDGTTPVADLYFYLDFSGNKWKISAMRALAMTGMIQAAGDELGKKANRSAEENWELANIKLILSVDKDLRKYFYSHQTLFAQLGSCADQMKSSVQVEVATSSDKKATERNTKLDATMKSTLRALSLEPTPSAEAGYVQFFIGGMSDNEVGYLYSPTNRPPQISRDAFIWVEKIADKWYLIRTT